MATVQEELRPLIESELSPPSYDGESPKDDVEVTPLPMKQISILLLMLFTEPIASTVIYPFIAELVNETGVTGGDPSKIGYYAGLIESIFFFTEGLFVLQYGRISDRIGRRPVLLFGLFGLTISIFFFGLSKTFTGIVLTRALSGALNGNIGVSKSMLGELTDDTNQAQCFAYMPIVWAAGCTIGPFIGGTLAHPAALLPRIFDTPFWKKYPYFLPCLASAVFTAAILIYSAFSLEETLYKHPESKPVPAESGTVDEATRLTPSRAPSIRSVLTKRACIAILNYGFLAFIDISYLGLIPVMLAASVEGGGLGLTPRSIGLILGLQGIVTGIVPILCFAPIHRRFGSKLTYTVGLAAYTFLFASLPMMNTLARHEMWNTLWFVMGLHLLFSCPAFMTFSCITIFITSSAPSRSSLGTLNGISQTTISAIRAIGPATATSLFAFSVEKQILGGWFVYAVLICLNLAGLVATMWLKDEKRAH